MLDFLRRLRLQNLYNPDSWNQNQDDGMEPTFPMDMGPQNVDPNPAMNPNTPNPAPMNGMGMGGDAIDQLLSKLYTPEHTQSDRMNSMLNNYPNRDDPKMKPHGVGGFLTKLAAVAGGMTGGPDLYGDVMNHKFNDKLKDWTTQIGPVERSAALEKENNSNERTMTMQTIANKLREESNQMRDANNQKTADLKQQTIDNKAKTDEQNMQIRQQRADVYEFKAKNPGLKLVMTKGGNVMAMDPVSGQLHDTGIPTGSLTDADKMALGHDYNSQEIEQRGTIQKDIVGIRHDNTDEEIDRRGDQARTTKSTPSGNNTGANKPELPSQTRVRQINKARELSNSRPDLRPFISLGPGNNDFKIAAPGKSMFGKPTGPTPAQYKEMNDAIYGTTGNMAPVPSHDTTSNVSTPNTKSNDEAPPAPKGWKYVRKASGGWTAVKDNGGL